MKRRTDTTASGRAATLLLAFVVLALLVAAPMLISDRSGESGVDLEDANARAADTEGWPRTDLSVDERIAIAIHALEHEGPKVQRDALEALVRDAAQSVDALLAAARERGGANPHLLYNIMGALRSIGDPKATPLAAESLAGAGDDYPLRRRSAQTIGACGGPKAEAALLGSLDTDYIPLAVEIIDALTALRATGSAKAIIARVKTMPEIRHHVLRALSTGLVGAAEPDDLAVLLPEDAPPLLRAAYLEARGRLGDAEAWKTLDAMLKTDSEALRLEFAVRLLEAKRESGRTAVEKLLDAKDPRVAAEALRFAARTPGLATARVVASLTETNHLAVFDRLKQIGPRLGETAIRDAVVARFVDPDEEMSVRVVAANRLAEADSPDAWKPLIARLKKGGGAGGPESITHSIGCALARTPAAVPQLVSLLTSGDEATSRGALAGLARIGGPTAATAVAGLLERKEIGWRREAAQILGQIGTAEELPLLKAAWHRETDPTNRAIFAHAAQRIARSGR